MNFGQAIEALKNGDRVSRAGWNGKNMWLQLVKAQDEFHLPYIEMKTADKLLVPWLASQTDVLATDWDVC